MAQVQEITQNQVQQSFLPMVRIWGRSIGWTIVLSALLAVLFSLALDGCSSIAGQHHTSASQAVMAPQK
jgi:hypothetical protein